MPGCTASWTRLDGHMGRSTPWTCTRPWAGLSTAGFSIMHHPTGVGWNRDNCEEGFSRFMHGKSWHVGISGFCCHCWNGWDLKSTWANKSTKGLKSSSYLSTVPVPSSWWAGSGASWHSLLCIAHRHYASKIAQMLFPGNGFEIQSVGNKGKRFARKTGYSSAFTFDSTVNRVKKRLGSISLILAEGYHFMEILRGKYSLLA